MGIYFRRTIVLGNLFLKRRASSKHPKIKPFKNYQLYGIFTQTRIAISSSKGFKTRGVTREVELCVCLQLSYTTIASYLTNIIIEKTLVLCFLDYRF